MPLPQAAQARNISIGIVSKHSANFKIGMGGRGDLSFLYVSVTNNYEKISIKTAYLT